MALQIINYNFSEIDDPLNKLTWNMWKWWERWPERPENTANRWGQCNWALVWCWSASICYRPKKIIMLHLNYIRFYWDINFQKFCLDSFNSFNAYFKLFQSSECFPLFNNLGLRVIKVMNVLIQFCLLVSKIMFTQLKGFWSQN